MNESDAAWRALRAAVPEVLATLLRRSGDFDACEDAVQEALLDAARRWPAHGWPDNPAAWLTTAARRRLVDQHRSDTSRRRREDADAVADVAPPPLGAAPAAADDSLALLVMCAHPALRAPSQVALTLRAVGGLTTAEIARGLLVPEATVAQRISRAKARIADAGARFELPAPDELDARVDVVRTVLYLVFNEGHTATSGEHLLRADLSAEAIRLTRMLRAARPDEETSGLLALMLLSDARRAARTTASGALVPLVDQDRSRWDAEQIAEGLALVSDALATGPVGPYQVQAAIAALHDEAPTASATDWPQILALYDLLERLTPGPIVTLNRAVAVAMVHGPKLALAIVDDPELVDALATTHRRRSVRAHLLEMDGRIDEARVEYLEAARRATSTPEQRHLRDRAARLS